MTLLVWDLTSELFDIIVVADCLVSLISFPLEPEKMLFGHRCEGVLPERVNTADRQLNLLLLTLEHPWEEASEDVSVLVIIDVSWEAFKDQLVVSDFLQLNS